MRNKKGFTLIELLVVIAIIGLLSTLSVVSLNSARAKARDAKRASDARSVQTAIEMCANEANGAFPSQPTTYALIKADMSCGSRTLSNFLPSIPPEIWYRSGGTNDTATYTIQYWQETKDPAASSTLYGGGV
ncbi:MAG: type II secretion system protein [Patescibacteria group bacterium]|nr:type II secretion system protein [Patescibacteria group bacterium]